MSIILFYVTVIILFWTYVSLRKRNEDYPQGRSPLLYIIYASVGIGLFSPLLTLALSLIDGTTLQDAGPIGDWIAGSTVPFFTFAAFLTAYMAYMNQKEELEYARKTAEQQSKAIELGRFENTLFHLLNEMQNFHDRIVVTYSKRPEQDHVHVYGQLFSEFKGSLEAYLKDKNKKQSAARIERLVQEGKISQDERSRRYERALLDKYANALRGCPLYEYAELYHLHKYIKSILLLIRQYKLEEKDYPFYIHLLNIYLSNEALQLSIYYAFAIPEDEVSALMRTYGMIEYVDSEEDQHFFNSVSQ
ncbi:hypothetical protein B5M42_006925 [Paenibacillus athensensis]|uniref:Phage abortive infection protein n=1 Tax=Paenibacillus athensensis TaxID=1967502 RepID=A0A4Y8PZC1_9BACL|nr:hypothetical protein [Paenibacillus athensensis]MCD1258565.1 hypothetical protein [Paenibacillus athensensis]